ncbi:glycoside hydrolase family 16 protein [Kitasatospora purpeofusca]|uniref:glycoside hydrolase family 16 protein n=1 Tax=Kitasatospora purpeofusca TaxID=67352 RepID=UPI0022507F83|nr:glycoside hydrolase family 16 protein [Kitasatospora purpeofusca]MCX4756621.1 glycoside hydrolase family 16 protein [Kitasatospora purpeofusca]WSR35582.1 glycoside hydrolase family 16 protein [Kitasatospora purpeofusca]WSR43900.1 glycoside hydrolase family 16 protein [Kitasatospora purpeofusca]
MTPVRPWTPSRVLPALGGWCALAAQLLPVGAPLRAVVVTAFLLAGPGAAAVDWARPLPAPVRGPDRLSAAGLVVALSVAFAVLTAEALFFTGSFGAARAVLVLAVLTTVLTLLPRRLPRLPRHPLHRLHRLHRPHRLHRDRDRERRPDGRPPVRWRLLTVATVLALSAACGATGSIGSTGSGGSSGNGTGVGGVFDPSAPSASAPAAPASGTPLPVGADQPPSTGPWHSVFRDDFNGSGLDHGSWATCYDWNDGGCTNAGNQEDQWYLPGQVSVADGKLTLTAERKATSGSDGKTYPWTSGMVSTGRDQWDGTPRKTFTYGYFAAAIRTTGQAAGMFPAFWLLPAGTRGGLPELDIAEFINTDQYADLNLHAQAPDGTDIDAHFSHGPVDFSSGYHVFGLDWEPDAVTWYVDGVPVFQVTDPSVIPTVPMELILDLAVGYHQSPPAGVDRTQVDVDWVGVWQH